jgi:raffinose/stachyose/melibiose transport system permease protein
VKRYTWRTGILEGVMILAAILFVIPVYILVNLSIRPLGDFSSPLIPTKHPIFDNFVSRASRSSS